MNTKTIALATTALILIGGAYWLYETKFHGHDDTHSEADGHAHGIPDEHGHEEEGHTEERATDISDDAAKTAGIVTETAGPTNLGERLALRGKIILNPETSAEVKARFTGVVKSVRVKVGDTVKKGETLATIESNDSLQTYAVTSPLSGVILAQHAHVGDTAAEEPIFMVANLSTITAELHVFPQDISRISTGQNVDVQSVDGSIQSTGTVKALLPTTNADTQTVQVWVTLNNTDNRWRSGMAVQAGAVIGTESTPLAVKNTALQTLEDQTVVFVKVGTTYTAHPVKTGRTDGTFTEVLSGIDAGDTYVATNSFIIKADIGKSAAGHAH